MAPLSSSTFWYLSHLKVIVATTILICYCIKSIASTDIQKYVCLKKRTQLYNLNVNTTGNARIVDKDGGIIFEFSPEPSMDATFTALTSCRRKQKFIVHVNQYNPDILPDAVVDKIEIEIDGKKTIMSLFPSCKTVFNEMVMRPAKCKAGKENVICTKWIDPNYEESGYQLECSTSFDLICDLENYSAPIGGQDGVFFFNGNIHGFNPIMPCDFRIRTVKGFQLLVPARGKGGESIEECIESVKKEGCPHDPPQTTSQTSTSSKVPMPGQTPASKQTRTSNQTTTSTTISLTTPTTNLTTITINSSPTPPSPTKQSQTSFKACIKTIPFISLLIVFPLLIIILTVLIILKTCRSSKKVDRKKISRGNTRSAEAFNDDDMNVLIDEHSWRATKSVFMGNEPNIGDNATIFDHGTETVTKDDGEDEEDSDYQEDGIDVPPTKEMDDD